MDQFIGCDAHKMYSVFVTVNERGERGPAVRVAHDRETYRRFLQQLPPESPIALEASGNYYWIIDEMQAAGHRPRLTHPLEAKKRMGKTHKTDRLDAGGLGILLRNGTLPEVWIPPADLRDQRELLRLRMYLARMRTQVKGRIHGSLARYNLRVAATDMFGCEGREQLGHRLPELPAQTLYSVEQELATLDFLEIQIEEAEQRLAEMLRDGIEVRLLQTMPGVGPILSAVIALEIGDVRRFPRAEQLASYAGLVPRVHSSGGHTRLGQVAGDVNHYLKWAFIEAANVVCMQQRRWAERHAVRVYQKVKRTKNHPKAVVAVGRHLAEAAYWILTKGETYREPKRAPKTAVSSTLG